MKDKELIKWKKFLEFFKVRKPAVGEIWVFHYMKGNPWPGKWDTVKVIDVKNNFVKYTEYDEECVSSMKQFLSKFAPLE